MMAAFLERYRLVMGEARAVRVSLVLAIAINVLTWGLALWFVIPRLGFPFLALHYSIYFGTDRIGPPWRFFLGPALGTLLIVVNSVIAAYVHVNHRLASAFLMVMTVLLEGLLAASAVLAMLLNL